MPKKTKLTVVPPSGLLEEPKVVEAVEAAEDTDQLDQVIEKKGNLTLIR